MMPTPMVGPDVIGRDAELARARAVIDGDRALLVTGEPGIGKTTLIRAALATGGRRVLEGGGYATLMWRPYFPLSRALRTEVSGDADWVADLVERVVGPDVLYIDDLQWTDDGTRTVLERLVGRIALVMATRVDPSMADPLAAMEVRGAERLELTALTPEAAAAVARRTGSDLSEARLEAIAKRAGGNPFLIEQLATGDGEAGLRRTIAHRLRAAGITSDGPIGLLALAERPLPIDVLGDDRRDLLASGFVIEAEDGLTLRHALLADAVIAELDGPTRVDLHARLAGIVTSPGERARHLLAAGARAAAQEAALEAVAGATSPGERAAHLGLAAAAAEGLEADALRIDAAAALRMAGDLDAAIALLDAVTSPEAEVRARAAAIRARVCWSMGEPEAMRAAIDDGLTLVAGQRSVAEAMLRAEAVVVTALVDGRFDDGLRDADAAVALAAEVGADRIRPLLLRATILTGLGLDGWEAALEAVVDAAREAGDAETELSATNNLVTGHEMHGRPAAGRTLVVGMIERARVLRLAGWERQGEALLVDLDLHAGDIEGALRRAEHLLEGPLDPLAAQQVGLAASLCLVDLGRFEEATPILERCLATAADDVTGVGDVLFVQAEAALWGGRPADALKRIDAYRRYETSEYPTSHLVDVTAGWAALERGIAPPPRLAHTEPAGMLVGATLERDALDLLAAGPSERVATAFAAAADAYVGFHRRGELRARWASAEARRAMGDVDGARAALEALELDAAAGPYRPLLGRIHRSLRLVGVRRSSVAGVEDRSTPVGARLTTREREICRLVANGESNIEIARRLGVGRPTVARLLGSAMGKLGVDSRAQVAARLDDG